MALSETQIAALNAANGEGPRLRVALMRACEALETLAMMARAFDNPPSEGEPAVTDDRTFHTTLTVGDTRRARDAVHAGLALLT
jgi:hypothetical protein